MLFCLYLLYPDKNIYNSTVLTEITTASLLVCFWLNSNWSQNRLTHYQTYHSICTVRNLNSFCFCSELHTIAGPVMLLMDTTLNAPDIPCHTYSVCSPHYLCLLNIKTGFALYQSKLNWAIRYILCLSNGCCAWQCTNKCNALWLRVIPFPYTSLFDSLLVNSVPK
jgi:hypothetical protein